MNSWHFTMLLGITFIEKIFKMTIDSQIAYIVLNQFDIYDFMHFINDITTSLCVMNL